MGRELGERGAIAEPGQRHNRRVAKIDVLFLVGREHGDDGGHGGAMTEAAECDRREVPDARILVLHERDERGRGWRAARVAQHLRGLGADLGIGIRQKRRQRGGLHATAPQQLPEAPDGVHARQLSLAACHRGRCGRAAERRVFPRRTSSNCAFSRTR